MPPTTKSEMTHQADAPLATIPATPEAMLQSAIENKMDPAAMAGFYELFRTMKADQARQKYTEAMSAFKALCPAIPRRTQNSFFKKTIVDHNGNETKVPTTYASLEDIGETIRDPLDKCGLSFRFDGLKVEGDMVTLSCVVSHVGGHSERSPVTLPYKSNAGSSDQQKMGAAMTYAQRYSLIQALGLTTCEEDDDGNEGGLTVSEEQAATIEAAVDSVGGNKVQFLKMLKSARFLDIPLSKYGFALLKIEEKRKGAKK